MEGVSFTFRSFWPHWRLPGDDSLVEKALLQCDTSYKTKKMKLKPSKKCLPSTHFTHFISIFMAFRALFHEFPLRSVSKGVGCTWD